MERAKIRNLSEPGKPEAGNSLLVQTDAAAVALLAMLRKLESDEHIRVAQPPLPSAVLLPELIAFCCARLSLEGRDPSAGLGRLLPLLAPAEDAAIRRGIEARMKDFSEDKEALPACFEVLVNFDAMAQAYEGAFYSRMGTEDPGALSEYYLALFEALWMLAGGRPEDRVYKETEEKLRGRLCGSPDRS